MKLSDKVAIITGGAQGLGRGFTEGLLQNGAKVCFCDVNRKGGEATLKELQNKYGEDRVAFMTCNVADHDRFDAVFRGTVRKFGGVDIVVNNAGITAEGSDWRNSIMVNLIGVIEGSKLAETYMSKQNGGRGGVVVNIASTAGLTPVFYTPVYAGTKYGVVGFTRSLAGHPDNEKNGMRYVCLCPAFTNTSMIVLDEEHTKKSGISAAVDEAIDLMQKTGINTVESVVNGFMQLVTTDDNNGGVMTVTAKRGAEYRHGIRRKNKL